MNWFRNLDTVVRRVIVLGVITCLLVVIGLTVGWCSRREEVQTAKDQTTIGDARMKSAVEAIDAIGDNAAANSATKAQVEDAQDAVNRETDPVVRDAVARRELCKLQRPDGPC